MKESDRHSETGLIAEVKVNTCTSDKVYQFIKELKEASFFCPQHAQRGHNFQWTKTNSGFAITDVKKRLRCPEYISSVVKVVLIVRLFKL